MPWNTHSQRKDSKWQDAQLCMFHLTDERSLSHHYLTRAIQHCCNSKQARTVSSIRQMKLKHDGNLMDFTSDLLLSHNHGTMQVVWMQNGMLISSLATSPQPCQLLLLIHGGNWLYPRCGGRCSKPFTPTSESPSGD